MEKVFVVGQLKPDFGDTLGVICCPAPDVDGVGQKGK